MIVLKNYFIIKNLKKLGNVRNAVEFSLEFLPRRKSNTPKGLLLYF